MKRKKFRFNVELCIEELNSVPLVSGFLFTKLRVEDGSKYKQQTQRVEVKNHCVVWNQQLKFPCKLTASSDTGILDKCLCRLSVRKEVKGGKSHQKLGYADLNLSRYAGQGKLNRNYILQGYDEKHRLDNSMLRISLMMSLLSGDPLFKVPSETPSHASHDLSACNDLTPENKGDNFVGGEDSGASNSSGFDSMTRIPKTLPLSTMESMKINHSRNSSSASEISKTSVGYGTAGRGSGHVRNGSSDLRHMRNVSSGSAKLIINLRKNGQSERDERIDSTRVDADDLVNELLGNISLDDSQEARGLQLYISQDGTASVTGHV